MIVRKSGSQSKVPTTHKLTFSIHNCKILQFNELEIEKLKFENQALKEELAQLEKQKKTDKEFKKNTQVTLANTDVQEITSKFNNQKYQIKISYPKSYFTNKEKNILYCM